MTYNEQELVPFDKVKSELLSLCTQGQSGDFCILSEQKHVAIINLAEGKIVGMRYRIKRGMEALEQIKAISKARIRFEKKETAQVNADSSPMPPTLEILKTLQVDLNADLLRQFGKKILVVEDSRTQRRIICEVLNQNGYQVMEAADGYEALKAIEIETPGLVLLDIVLPGLDGYEVMSGIKKMPGMQDVPIIMLTSRDKLIDKMRGKMSGTDEYLTKPVTADELMKKINKYLGTAEGGDPSGDIAYA